MDYNKLFLFPFLNLDGTKASHNLEPGSAVPISKFCQKRCSKDSKCISYYETLKNSPPQVWQKCPYGFSSYIINIEKEKYAISGIVPFPRFNSSGENERAKESPENRTTRRAVENNAQVIRNIIENVNATISYEMTRNLAALHEVRKYNRTVRQNLERICRAQSAADPDLAAPELVRAWKLSELMSTQFEVLGLIADGNLTAIAPKTNSEVYRFFDKCVRIYRDIAKEKSISISIRGDSPTSIVSDKTFSILPTVLIDNAIKYGANGTSVEIEIKIIGLKKFRISVSNEIAKDKRLPADPFKKGVRGEDNLQIDGSGVGLYLAQQVAAQHSTKIEVERISTGHANDRVTFWLEMHSS